MDCGTKAEVGARSKAALAPPCEMFIHLRPAACIAACRENPGLTPRRFRTMVSSNLAKEAKAMRRGILSALLGFGLIASAVSRP